MAVSWYLPTHRDERMGPWRPLPPPRRAIRRYQLASRVAVFRDQLEEAGLFPFVRYFWAPDLRTEHDERQAAVSMRIAERIRALGPNPSPHDYVKAVYDSPDFLTGLVWSGSSLLAKVPLPR